MFFGFSRRRGMKIRAGRLLTAILLVVFGCAALADVPTDPDQIPEIVVTAQKRTENLQTVPVSITTFGSQELKERAVENFMDYATSVPNLGFGASGDRAANSRTLSIRGVSGDNTTGCYLDETPLPDLVNNLTYSYVGESKSANNNPFNPRTRSPYALLDARCALAFGRNEV